MYRLSLVIGFFLVIALATTSGCEEDVAPGIPKGGNDTPIGSDGDGDSEDREEDENDDDDDDVDDGIDDVIRDTENDSGDDGKDDPPQEDQDLDGDGFSPAQGDCRDTGEGAEFINPDAKEDLGPEGKGDEVDNDCDGEVDEVETCDCPSVDKDAGDLAAALGLCDSRFVLNAEMDKTSPNGEIGWDTLESMGNNNCLVAQEGCEMAVISTGRIGQPNPNNGGAMGGVFVKENKSIDPQPDYQGDKPNTAAIKPSCDRTQLRLRLKAPTNAMGFSFDFLFGSAEYDEWINKDYNDTFYAILEYAEVNNGQTTNISFDSNGNEVEVDSNFFENNQFPCDEAGSGWGTMVPKKSGTTGWLRTSWNVTPGTEFSLTFSIHDEGDCLFDSITFLDNWQWHTEEVEPGTEPVVI